MEDEDEDEAERGLPTPADVNLQNIITNPLSLKPLSKSHLAASTAEDPSPASAWPDPDRRSGLRTALVVNLVILAIVAAVAVTLLIIALRSA